MLYFGANKYPDRFFILPLSSLVLIIHFLQFLTHLIEILMTEIIDATIRKFFQIGVSQYSQENTCVGVSF